MNYELLSAKNNFICLFVIHTYVHTHVCLCMHTHTLINIHSMVEELDRPTTGI
jgi:hypothetical protein